MKLYELAFASFVYAQMSDYDSSYRRFLESTNHLPDLAIDAHRKALLEWLNDWGCRQFALGYHDLASAEINDWYKAFGAKLPPSDRTLLELSDVEIEVVGQAYESLTERKASLRGQTYVVRIGPTGAAKILFALRPKSLIPWDEPIRGRLQRSYSEYLRYAKSEIKELGNDCIKNGIEPSDLPRLLDRPSSSLAKLVDEYFWVTITKNCPAPTKNVLSQWAIWK